MLRKGTSALLACVLAGTGCLALAGCQSLPSRDSTVSSPTRSADAQRAPAQGDGESYVPGAEKLGGKDIESIMFYDPAPASQSRTKLYEDELAADGTYTLAVFFPPDKSIDSSMAAYRIPIEKETVVDLQSLLEGCDYREERKGAVTSNRILVSASCTDGTECEIVETETRCPDGTLEAMASVLEEKASRGRPAVLSNMPAFVDAHWNGFSGSVSHLILYEHDGTMEYLSWDQPSSEQATGVSEPRLPMTLEEHISLIREHGVKEKARFDVTGLWSALSGKTPQISMDNGYRTLRSDPIIMDAPSSAMFFVDRDAAVYPVYTYYPSEEISSYEGVLEAFRNAGVPVSEPQPEGAAVN